MTITKTCPFCREQIISDAIKCRYCGEMLGDTTEHTSIVRPWLQYSDVELAPFLIKKICTSCGFIGNTIQQAKGSGCIESILWLGFFVAIFFFNPFIAVIPCLFYSIWKASNRVNICPKCLKSTMIPVNSVIGRRLLLKWIDEEQETTTKTCPSCGERILAIAIKCIHCGEGLDEESKANVIKQTEDVWRLQQMLSAYVAILGLAVLLLSEPSSKSFAIGIFILGGGAIWFIAAKIHAWVDKR